MDDVVAILDGLLNVVRSDMKRDLSTTSYSSALLLKQCFEQAEEQRITLSTDLPCTEDRRLLGTMEQWDKDVHGGGGAPPPLLKARANMQTRPSARALPVIGQAQDPKMLAELASTREDNATLQVCVRARACLACCRSANAHRLPFFSFASQERFDRLQVQCSSAMREKSALQSQVYALQDAAGGASAADQAMAELHQQIADLQHELSIAQQSGGQNDALMNELHGLQDANAGLAAELDAARAESQQRVERSQQFVNLRQMLAKKNQVVRQLRETLQANGIPLDDVDAQDD